MGQAQAIIYCSTCGDQIHDKDLQSGKAVALLDKTFCDDCKEEVFAQLRGDEPDSKMMPATTKSHAAAPHPKHFDKAPLEIGRASCRERVS
jgi:hypothetical protein